MASCVGRVSLQGKKRRARASCCLAWPGRPVRGRERVLPLAWPRPTSPLPRHPRTEGPGPTGSLWKQESTCDLESEGPAKGITMRTVSRHGSLGCVPTWGMGVRRHTGKPDGVFQGHGLPWREAQGPFACPSPSQFVPEWLEWEHGRRGDTRLMASEAEGSRPLVQSRSSSDSLGLAP